MASAATGPRGSVALGSSALLKVGSTQCGKVNGSWISGKATKIKSKNYFVSYTKSSQLYSADAKKSRGAQKRKLLNLSSDFKKKANTGNKKCSRYNASLFTPGNSSATVPGAAPTTVPGAAPTTVPGAAPTTVPVNLSAPVLKFDFTGAVGLVLQETPESTASATAVSKSASLESNLYGLTKSGDIFYAVQTGSITVKEFLIAPNDTIYIHSESVIVNGVQCVLLAVSIASGIPDCVESEKEFDNWNTTGMKILDGFQDIGDTKIPGETLYQKFQFDDRGGIAYAVNNFELSRGHFYGDKATEVRYYRAGNKFVVRPTNPFPDNGNSPRTPVSNFLLLRDGSLLVDEVEYPAEDYLPFDSCHGFGNDDNYYNNPRCLRRYRLMHYYPDGRRVAVSGFPTNLRNSFYRFKPLTFLNRLPDNRIIVGAQFGWVEIDAVKDEVKGEYLAWRSIKTNANCCYDFDFTIVPNVVNNLQLNPLFDLDTAGCPALNDLERRIWAATPPGTRTDNSNLDRFDARYSAEFLYLMEICHRGARHWRNKWFAGNRLIVLTSSQNLFTPPDSALRGESWNGNDGDMVYQGLLIQAYPTFKPIVTSITSVDVVQPVLNSALVSGLDVNGASKSILFDFDTGVETTLTSGLEGLRVRSFTLNVNENSVYFGARRETDRKWVLGKVNMATKVVTILKESPKRLLNIEMLNADRN
jgi:hypothetical protein